ncbi:hypothetical protein AbraIFM66951_010859 [Aspergillus brasiliensis]|uniref:Uncharacterized protein n=1 Tax=Aspergillus brasiliensis TaxID=319629 RepID=A0A9W6DJH8_9EURO|nr:hypothetical protein AbraCBS73388_010054 [Aspergillus brasiliensis]GKZ47492.1 hypothetical protein AbraIFM66951_010859 [Aspergillus brasiliensis]
MAQMQAQPSSSSPKGSPQQSSPPSPSECLTHADGAPNPVSIPEIGDNVSDDVPNTEHSAAILPEEESAHEVQALERLFNGSGQRWAVDLQKVAEVVERLDWKVLQWVMEWVKEDVGMVPDEHMNSIISALEGWCVQDDWTVLQGLLPPRRSLADHFAEALIHKAIMENVLSNSFQYLDGKTGPTDQGEDDCFASKLQYLYERFFKTNPNFATLWKEQTHRLANSTGRSEAPGDLSFGRENAKRLQACAPSLADEVLASEPVSLLLKEPLGPDEAPTRRQQLIQIFEASLEIMEVCETRVGGHFKMKQLSQLGSSYESGSSYMLFHPTNGYRVDEMDFQGRKILLIARPTIMYTDSEPGEPSSLYNSVTTIIYKASVVLDKGDGATESAEGKKRISKRPTFFEEGDVLVNTSEEY